MNTPEGSPSLDITPASPPRSTPGFEARILRLVRGKQERSAIERGEIDAIMDGDSGRAILLPEAQSALLDLHGRFRSLVNLASDGYWEQDADHRFTACEGLTVGATNPGGALGLTLWELPLGLAGSVDWQTHRTQLEWRAVFRDFELVEVADGGTLRYLALSGEPIFDDEDRFVGYRGITRDVTASRRAHEDTSRQAQRVPTGLDRLPMPICVVDTAGRITAFNAAWQGQHRAAGDGRSAEECYPDVSAAIRAGLAQVAHGERDTFRFERRVDTPHGQRWFEVVANAEPDAGQQRLLLAHHDQTELRHALCWRALESTVALCLAAHDERKAALEALLRAVCAEKHWDCGQYFAFDGASKSLAPDAHWGVAAPEIERYLDRARGTRVAADAGLVGRAWQAGQPLWTRDDQGDPRLTAALAHEVGLRNRFLQPVAVDGVRYGVLAFAHRAAMDEPDEQCLRAMQTIGVLLAHYLRRNHAHDITSRNEERYRRYTAIASDWQFEMNQELRIVASTEVGIGEVGDIIGKHLWELPCLQVDEAEWIKLRAMLAARWSFCDFACTAMLRGGHVAHYCLSGEAIIDEAGVFTGFLGVGLDVTPRPA